MIYNGNDLATYVQMQFVAFQSKNWLSCRSEQPAFEGINSYYIANLHFPDNNDYKLVETDVPSGIEVHFQQPMIYRDINSGEVDKYFCGNLGDKSTPHSKDISELIEIKYPNQVATSNEATLQNPPDSKCDSLHVMMGEGKEELIGKISNDEILSMSTRSHSIRKESYSVSTTSVVQYARRSTGILKNVLKNHFNNGNKYILNHIKDEVWLRVCEAFGIKPEDIVNLINFLKKHVKSYTFKNIFSIWNGNLGEAQFFKSTNGGKKKTQIEKVEPFLGSNIKPILEVYRKIVQIYLKRAAVNSAHNPWARKSSAKMSVCIQHYLSALTNKIIIDCNKPLMTNIKVMT